MNPADEGRTFLGRLAEDLSDLVASQSQVLFSAREIAIPVRSVSLMVALDRLQPATATDLADALEKSHQLVSQKLPKLLQLGLVERIECPTDRRRKLYSLTEAGCVNLERFADLQPALERAYTELAAEVGDIHALLRKTARALETVSLAERIGAAANGA